MALLCSSASHAAASLATGSSFGLVGMRATRVEGLFDRASQRSISATARPWVMSSKLEVGMPVEP